MRNADRMPTGRLICTNLKARSVPIRDKSKSSIKLPTWLTAPEDINPNFSLYQGSMLMFLLGVTNLQRCCLGARRFQIQYLYCQRSIVFLCDVMAVWLLPFHGRGTITLRLVRYIRRCSGSGIVYLRVPMRRTALSCRLP